MTRKKAEQQEKIPRRGEIWHCRIPHATGREIYKDRPAIILGTPAKGARELYTVVFCSSSASPEQKGHVVIRSLGKESVAMAEQLFAVDKSRLETRLGALTGSERLMVEAAVLGALGMTDIDMEHMQEAARAEARAEMLAALSEGSEKDADVVVLRTQRDTYKALYTDLLERTVGKAEK